MMSRKMDALSRYAQPVPIRFIYQTNNPLYRSIFSGDTSGPCNSQRAYGSAWRTDPETEVASLRLSTRKKELYSEKATETQKKKAGRKRNGIRKGDAKKKKKKKRTGESGVIKGMGAQYRKTGREKCSVVFIFLCLRQPLFAAVYRIKHKSQRHGHKSELVITKG